jgi:hypothetical protein
VFIIEQRKTLLQSMDHVSNRVHWNAVDRSIIHDFIWGDASYQLSG